MKSPSLVSLSILFGVFWGVATAGMISGFSEVLQSGEPTSPVYWSLLFMAQTSLLAIFLATLLLHCRTAEAEEHGAAEGNNTSTVPVSCEDEAEAPEDNTNPAFDPEQLDSEGSSGLSQSTEPGEPGHSDGNCGTWGGGSDDEDGLRPLTDQTDRTPDGWLPPHQPDNQDNNPE